MNHTNEVRYSHNIEEHVHIMSFARELKVRDISIGGLSFFSPNYEHGDIVNITITIPKSLQIFNEKIEIISVPTEEENFQRAKFVNPSVEFVLMFKEFMENNDCDS